VVQVGRRREDRVDGADLAGRREDRVGLRRKGQGARHPALHSDWDDFMPPAEDPRLVRLTEICLALPEASRVLSGDHADFTVRKKTFGYFLNNHHGDGIVAVSFKAEPGVNGKLVALDPNRFYLPAYIGPRGWVGLRLEVGNVDWDEVADFVGDSYRLVAPKRLIAVINQRTS
jgi:predicted DNA-binding protein (MmcQ/YjbR family)